MKYLILMVGVVFIIVSAQASNFGLSDGGALLTALCAGISYKLGIKYACHKFEKLNKD